MIDIALIGAGQLGSRHLQALALLDRPARLTVVDPSTSSLRTAEERFTQANRPNSNIESIQFLSSFEKLPKRLAAAVVATNADVRRDAIERLLAASQVRYLLFEKVLFQRHEDFRVIGAKLTDLGVLSWVNCAQRMWPFFQNAKSRLQGKRNVHIVVKGSSWGLGCNSIHNLDLIPFFTGSTDFELSSSLDSGVVKSRREGFVEFTGTLHAVGKGGFSVTQTSYRDGNHPFTFELLADDYHSIWRVSETKALVSDASNGWSWCEETVTTPYQSQLSHLVIQQVLDSGRCDLPTFDESAVVHARMLREFLAHLADERGFVPDHCPIT